jgi:RNA polymerase sigma-70 factor (ECF subfamily)
VPNNPEAWLLTAARRKMIDAARQRHTRDGTAEHLLLLAELAEDDDDGHAAIPDDRLALMFACAHPGIAPEVRAPLMLQVTLGFDAATIASAFLVAPSTMGQRSRGPRPRSARPAFRFACRCSTNGASGSTRCSQPSTPPMPKAGSTRPAPTCGGATWPKKPSGSASLVATLLPRGARGAGPALADAARPRAPQRAARCAGRYVPLAEQDPALWDAAMIDEAEALLSRAPGLVLLGAISSRPRCSRPTCVRRRSGRADWPAIEQLYDALVAMTGSPVAEINRAIAVAETRGPAAGAGAARRAGERPAAGPVPAVLGRTGRLLARVGQRQAADQAYERAMGLETDAAVREFLQQRRLALAAAGP